MSFTPLERHFICGMTGSGKTTFASQEFKKLNTLCILVNPAREVIPEEASQIVVCSTDEVIEAINSGYRKICYNPKGIDSDITPEEINELRQILFNIGIKINMKRRKPLIVAHLFIDEVHEFSSLRQPNKDIDRLFKRGRRHGVIGVAISQRPADVSHTILTQCQYHVIFKLGTYEIPYFERYHIPIEEHTEWLKNDYHFIIFDGETVTRYYPIEVD